MGAFEIIAGICSIASLVVSLFVANRVVKISNSFNHDNHSKITNKLKNNTINGSYTGGNVNDVENHKQA